MKKIKLALLSVFVLVLSACGGNADENTLFVMNWGDYISDDVISRFEQEYGVTVVLSEVESNEAMFEQIRTNRTNFDIAVPSDYMIEQLDQNGLLNPIDFSLVPNFNPDNLNHLVREHGPNSDKFIPYFNGTIGIMYSTRNHPDMGDIVRENGWTALFNQAVLPPGTRVGMYNSSRDAFAAALLKEGYSINTTDPAELNFAFHLLHNMNFAMYGDDNLKRNIGTGNLDLALVYSGDFFDELYAAIEDGRQVTFGFYTPLDTNYWIDGFVIPTTSRNLPLAHKFLNFMMDEENAVENAGYVGYASPFTNVMDALREDEEMADFFENPFFDPAAIEGLRPQSFHFLGLEYMMDLESRFIQSKAR